MAAKKAGTKKAAKRKVVRKKPASKAAGPMAMLPVSLGEKKNYNLKDYGQYHVSTIEWIPAEKVFRARVGFNDDGGYVFFNSYHQDFADAERAIDFVKEGKASGKLYNIFGETIEVHTSPTLGQVAEVLALIYSFVIT